MAPVGSQLHQYALRCAQVQVGCRNQIRPALKGDAAVGNLNVLRPETLDLEMQRGFGAKKQGATKVYSVGIVFLSLYIFTKKL